RFVGTCTAFSTEEITLKEFFTYNSSTIVGETLVLHHIKLKTHYLSKSSRIFRGVRLSLLPKSNTRSLSLTYGFSTVSSAFAHRVLTEFKTSCHDISDA